MEATYTEERLTVLMEDSPAGRAAVAQLEVDIRPNVLRVPVRTWLSLRGMKVDVTLGNIEYIDEGTHIWHEFYNHWGWWKLTILGWYPYTELRDYQIHETQGIGRPWLRLLPEIWQELIFRELVLLIKHWNAMVDEPYAIRFRSDEKLPQWVERWLSLTNHSWRLGYADLEREIYECSATSWTPEAVAGMVQRYQASAVTWRGMMPERMEYHRRYGTRDEYWTIESE